MKKFCSLSLLLIGLFISGSAQNPGYLGDHFGLSYQAGFFLCPVWEPVEGDPYRVVWPSVKHTFSLDMTVSQKLNLDLNYSYFSAQAAYPSSEVYPQPGFPGPYLEFTPLRPRHDMHAHFFELSANIFIGKYIAPIGTHIILRGGAILAKLNKGNQISGNYYSGGADTIVGEPSYTGGRFGFGIGKRMMIAQKIYLKYSFLAYLFAGEPFGWDTSGTYGIKRDYVGYYLGRATRVLNRYEINLGVGLLLF